jgi:hypothetical protein
MARLIDPKVDHRTAPFSKPNAGQSEPSVPHGCSVLRRDTSVLNATTLEYATGTGITAGAGTGFVLQLILAR